MSDVEAQRVDKWLWHARFAKTRSAAQRLVLAGHVRVNRDKISSASRLVRPGDVLTIALSRQVLVIRVSGIADRRGSASTVQALYRHESGAGTAPEAGELPSRPSGKTAEWHSTAGRFCGHASLEAPGKRLYPALQPSRSPP